MKTLKISKFLGIAFFLSIIFTLHILNFDNLNTTNSLLQLNGENSSNVIIDNAQKVDILSNKSGGFFVLSENNLSTKISFLDRNCIESNSGIKSTQINSKYLDAKVINDDIYLLVINGSNEKQIIKISFSNGNFNSSQFLCQFPDGSTSSSFCIAENTLFFVENSVLYGFTIETSPSPGELLSEVNSIFLDYAGDYLYVVKETGAIDFCSVDDLKTSVANENSPNFNSLNLSDEVDLKNNPVNFLNDELFMSSTGKLFKINMNQGIPGEIVNVFTLDVSEISIFNCSTILNFESKDYLFCKTSANKANLFDTEDNFSKKYSVSLDEESNIFSICSSLDNKILVYKTSDNKYFAKLISEEDLLEETNNDPNNPNDPENPQEPSGNGSDMLLGDYTTDNENKYILGVKLGTTVAVFKQNLNLNGEYTVSFKNYTGKEITSGKLGTGSVVSFWKDGKFFKEYTLVVDFDVTGEGNFNSRDLDYMYNEIFKNGKTTLTGEYFYSGDTDGDGQIDTLDLLKMRKALN